MHISFATANLYQEPFEDVLGMIAEAGYDAIELDLFWERKEWAMAQHLRGWSAKQVAASIERSGLRLASIHDGGGVLDDPESVAGYINPALAETIDALGYVPGCLVFHTPHVEGAQDASWWGRIEGRIAAELRPYQEICPVVTVENMPNFDGYSVPLLTPQALADFTQRFRAGGHAGHHPLRPNGHGRGRRRAGAGRPNAHGAPERLPGGAHARLRGRRRAGPAGRVQSAGQPSACTP